MAHPVIVVAPRLCLGTGYSGREEGLLSSYPFIQLGFPRRVADILDRELFPHAKPEDCFVGINPSGSAFEVFVHCVITLPRPVNIDPTLVVPGTVTPPFVYVVGNEADFPVDLIGQLLDCKGKSGKFCLTCGYEDESAGTLSDGTFRWRIELETIYGTDVMERCQRAFNHALGRSG